MHFRPRPIPVSHGRVTLIQVFLVVALCAMFVFFSDVRGEQNIYANKKNQNTTADQYAAAGHRHVNAEEIEIRHRTQSNTQIHTADRKDTRAFDSRH